MEELADDSKFHHQSLDVDYEVSIYHPSRLVRRQRRIVHPNISTLNVQVRTKQIGKKKTQLFFRWLFPATLLKKKNASWKNWLIFPQVFKGLKILLALRFPKKNATHSPKMTSHHPSEMRPRTHSPHPKKKKTQAGGVGSGLWEMPKKSKTDQKKVAIFCLVKNPLGLCFWVQKVGLTGVTYRHLHFFFKIPTPKAKKSSTSSPPLRFKNKSREAKGLYTQILLTLW